MFNKVYKDICRWQEALQLIPQLMPWLMKAGANWEAATGQKCDANSGRSLSDPLLDYDLDGKFLNSKDQN